MRIVDNEGGGSARSMSQHRLSDDHVTESPAEKLPSLDTATGETEIDAIEVVTDAHLTQLWSWNQTVPSLVQRCMHDIFVEQAQIQPEAIALQSWDGQLTYAELDALSARLAFHLMARGVQIGTRIPLCFEKSMWAVVAVLGVMRSGGTFSLTDPSQPEARLRTIVEQTGAKLVLTSLAHQPLGQTISSGDGQVLPVSRDFFDCEPEPEPELSNPAPLPTVPASSSMYIIFTSGSTGKPKGVVISHENYTSGALPRAEAVGYKSTSKCFDFPSYAFDVSIDCMLCTLAVGGRVCIPSEDARMNDLSGAIRSSKANMVHMTPSVARVLDADIIPSLDVLGLGGEAVSSSDAAAWSKNTSLIIAYGPSECTVGCTINNTVTVSTGIGKGCGGLTWIVDPEDHNRLMPVGEVGELIIEGPLVGVGYLDEPEKTAEVFIQDPVWLLRGHDSVSGRHGRLYKTGDLVKYEDNRSGSIEFVGRKDQQVKLRGQRVELAEVEHHLQACLPHGVKVAAEVIKPVDGSPTLIAFLSESPKAANPAGDGEFFVEPSPELAAALRPIDTTMGSRVPRYMVPAAFVTIRDMPSLVSRKLDRKKLREMALSIPREKLGRSQNAEAGEEELETAEEKQLGNAWRRVLGDSIALSRQSNFFHLGGDSLRAMRLIAAAREEGLAITVTDVFRYPALSSMAEKTSKLADTAQEQIPPFSLLQDWDPEEARQQAASLCGIDVEAVEDVYPCTPLQEALMALSAKVKEAYVAQRVVELDSLSTAESLVAAFSVAQKDCHILRTRIVQASGRGLMQVVVQGDLHWSSGSNLDEYLRSDRDEAMDLGRPLIRYAVIHEPASGKVSFVLTMHHALYDGWAMPLVVERVNRAFQNQTTLSRPAEFKHFIKYLTMQKRDESETFWRERLQGASGSQFPSLPWQGYQTRADSLLELYVPLERLPASNVTVATVIRAAWAIVASQYIDATDVVFGETLTGRNAPIVGAEEIEGPMITTIPIRVQVDRQSSVEEYLQGIQEQTITQIPHEHFGLQHIRRVSPDALEACELRTGLVLHPSTAADQPSRDQLPADRLVPAGDSEAAEEALKFNTYALMLVCSIDPKGFLIMASFDSKTVAQPVMERVLEQLKLVAQNLCDKTTDPLADISSLPESDQEKLAELSRQALPTEVLAQFPDAEAAHVVNSGDSNRLVPFGGTGRLILGSSTKLELPEVSTPGWAGESPDVYFYRTDKLAAYDSAGRLTLVERLSTTSKDGVVSRQSTQPRLSATSRKQRVLRGLWSRVLCVPEQDIGLNDTFFHLGGDSISAMKLVSEARLAGLALTVVQIFGKRSLYDMASAAEESSNDVSGTAAARDGEILPTFALLDDTDDKDNFVDSFVRPRLANPGWEVANVLPTRPLQQLAVQGTTQKPRFSARYELMYLDGAIDRQRLIQSCGELVARNEILRTVFIEREDGRGLGVVLKHLEAPVVEYEVDGDDMQGFARQLCHLDVLTKMPLGSSFVKWFLIQGDGDRSCLIFRISHAQYDEICLPLMLRQLSALYLGQPVRESVPFSSYVGHVLRKGIPDSVAYWRDLLRGSSMTILKPDIPVLERGHFAIERTIDISSRPRETTVATLPTAAWVLCLARRLSLLDVTFGEVVSGRNVDFAHADAVAGPCWQYIPVRVRLDASWTGLDLLDHVQHQHIASSAHECMGLQEIADSCTDWPPSSVDWFDSVVHQDVEHVESLDVSSPSQAQATGGTRMRMETLYVDEEPLREWKVQAFVRGEQLTLEIVTVRSWAGFAAQLLDDLVETAQGLVQQPHRALFSQS